MRSIWMAGLLAGLGSVAVAAQEDAATQLDRIVVTGDTADHYRFRSDSTSPRLIYDYDYFARFEPLSVGDMLKQVPGVAFTSDIGEYDAPQLRGIGTEYTQILINGQRVPGAGGDADNADRGVFVDRIPAELVERIEVIRSPQADLDSQGVGGSINIVLKTTGEFSGGQFRAGAFNSGDGTTRGSGYAGYAGQSGRWSWLGGVNVQGRYNPKDKKSQAFEAPEEPDEEGASARRLEQDLGFVKVESVIEDDVRDTLDVSLNGGATHLFGSGASLSINGFYIDTDRDEDQLARAFDGEGGLEVTETEAERIAENTLGVGTRYRVPAFGDGEMSVGLDYSRLDLEIDNETLALEEDTMELGRETIETDDDELRLSGHVLVPLAAAHRLKLGVQLATKDRDSEQRVFEAEADVGTEPEFEDASAANGLYEIQEDRYDAYAQHNWRVSDEVTLDFGLRVELTQMEQDGFDSDGNPRSDEDDQTEFNPNAHLLVSLTGNDQLRASVARTVRRPNFNSLVPFVIEDDEEFFVGNPELEPETSIGYDLGYEHRFARQLGIVGVNVFHRDIDDLIQDVEIDDTTSPDNIGDGTVYGVELDSSLPLAFAGLPGVNLYGNYTYLKSEVDDPFSGEERRFNRQPVYVYNLGLTHKIKPLRLTWGASFQQQGKAQEFQGDEIVRVEYDGNLEAFVEYEISENFSLKLNGNNLLDASKDEFFRKFDDPRPDGAIEQIEYETERIGRITVLTLRGRF
ncbi:MAG: TonB-dependent receptor plug domain-containing protein [Panacagrimonas sp.]